MSINKDNVTVRRLMQVAGSKPAMYEVVFNVHDEDGFITGKAGVVLPASELFERLESDLEVFEEEK